MNKEEIIDTINKYKLDKSRFCLISGASLVLMDEISNTNDIDISCNKDYYEYLLNNYNCMLERINEFNESIYMIDNIINFGTSFYPKKTIIINGILCSSLEDVLEVKKYLNRDKDKELILRLENKIKHN